MKITNISGQLGFHNDPMQSFALIIKAFLSLEHFEYCYIINSPYPFPFDRLSVTIVCRYVCAVLAAGCIAVFSVDIVD